MMVPDTLRKEIVLSPHNTGSLVTRSFTQELLDFITRYLSLKRKQVIETRDMSIRYSEYMEVMEPICQFYRDGLKPENPAYTCLASVVDSVFFVCEACSRVYCHRHWDGIITSIKEYSLKNIEGAGIPFKNLPEDVITSIKHSQFTQSASRDHVVAFGTCSLCLAGKTQSLMNDALQKVDRLDYIAYERDYKLGKMKCLASTSRETLLGLDLSPSGGIGQNPPEYLDGIRLAEFPGYPDSTLFPGGSPADKIRSINAREFITKVLPILWKLLEHIRLHPGLKRDEYFRLLSTLVDAFTIEDPRDPCTYYQLHVLFDLLTVKDRDKPVFLKTDNPLSLACETKDATLLNFLYDNSVIDAYDLTSLYNFDSLMDATYMLEHKEFIVPRRTQSRKMLAIEQGDYGAKAQVRATCFYILRHVKLLSLLEPILRKHLGESMYKPKTEPPESATAAFYSKIHGHLPFTTDIAKLFPLDIQYGTPAFSHRDLIETNTRFLVTLLSSAVLESDGIDPAITFSLKADAAKATITFSTMNPKLRLSAFKLEDAATSFVHFDIASEFTYFYLYFGKVERDDATNTITIKHDDIAFKRSALRSFGKEHDPILCWHDDLEGNLAKIIEDSLHSQIADFSESFAYKDSGGNNFELLIEWVYRNAGNAYLTSWDSSLVQAVNTILQQQLGQTANFKAKFLVSTRDDFGKYPFPNITKSNFDAAWFVADFAKDSTYDAEKKKSVLEANERSEAISRLLNNFLHVLYCFPPLPVHVLQVLEHQLLENHLIAIKGWANPDITSMSRNHYITQWVVLHYLDIYYRMHRYYQLTWGKIGPHYLSKKDIVAKGKASTVYMAPDAPPIYKIIQRSRIETQPIISQGGLINPADYKSAFINLDADQEFVIPLLPLFLIVKNKIRNAYFLPYSIGKFNTALSAEYMFIDADKLLYNEQGGPLIKDLYFNENVANLKYWLWYHGLMMFDLKVLPYWRHFLPKED